MDIPSYFRRLGYEGRAQGDLATLTALMQRHQQTIPFENLDIFDFGRQIWLDTAALFQKLVVNRRGGYCFELNGLFFVLLQELGFSCYPVAARVVMGKTTRPPLTHRAAVVMLDGGKYYCDVGFGGPGPHGPLRLLADTAQKVGPDVFLLLPQGRELVICRRTGNGWEPVLAFEDRPFEEADFALLNFYCSNSPDVLFTRQRVVNLTTEEGHRGILDNRLTVTRAGQSVVTELDTADALEQALEHYFGIRISLPQNTGVFGEKRR
ncbi:MAG: arylamine N-acetyltransferase [Oscillospiraceae bacterium]|nr:arylamine N-acetyltransferase [Oscillospiraceae bacterium]